MQASKQTLFSLQLLRVMSVPKEKKMLVKNETPNQKNFKSCQILKQNC